jgi:hypothetical protein
METRHLSSWLSQILFFVGFFAVALHFPSSFFGSSSIAMHSTARRVQSQWHAFPLSSPEFGLHAQSKNVQVAYCESIPCSESGKQHKFAQTKYDSVPSLRAFTYALDNGKDFDGYCLSEKKHRRCVFCGVSVSFKLVRKRREDELGLLNSSKAGGL